MKCCVLILNYNGRAHLETCVPSALQASAHVAGECPVVVVDNRSTDDSMAWLSERHPDVRSIVCEKNDYVFSLNRVVASRSEDIVILLNNDIRVDGRCFAAMLPHFEDPDVAMVNAAVFDWDGSKRTAAQRCGASKHFWFYKWWNFEARKACWTLEAGGPAFACRRSMFLELGGFDDLYRPGYYEDFDLSFRAWQRGWKAVHEPRSIVFHRESASMLKRYGQDKQTLLVNRNHLLFTAKNVGGWGFLGGFLLLLPVRAIRPLFRGDTIPLRGFLGALPRLPRAVCARFREHRNGRCSNEFLKKFARGALPLER